MSATVFEAIGQFNTEQYQHGKGSAVAASSSSAVTARLNSSSSPLTSSSLLNTMGGGGGLGVDKRLADRWEGVAIGEEASKFTFDSQVIQRPNRFNMLNTVLSEVEEQDEAKKAVSEKKNKIEEASSNRAISSVAVGPSIQIADLMSLEKNVTRLEATLRGVSFVSQSLLSMEQNLSAYEDNQQTVRRALDGIDVKTEHLYQQLRRQLGQALDPEALATMCRRMEVLAALAPAINAAKANIDALEAIVSEWEEVKKGAEMVAGSVDEHAAILDQVEADLEALENQLDTTEKNVAQTFDMFERELLSTAKRYL